jgi:hypothetical protein
VAGKGKQRTTFAKLQKERARQEKQEAKRARRHATTREPDTPSFEETTALAEDGPAPSMGSEA